MPEKDVPMSLVGADILNLVTTGMYHTPLAVYREYIQNSADAIECSDLPDQGRVEISIDPGERNVKIRDNGPGLTHAEARRALIPIARSSKQRGVDRGFRGIGRLAGLAFANRVRFRTRESGMQPVTEITWDGTSLRASALSGVDPEQLIHDCVAVSRITGSDWPDHFFEVELEHIARHAAGKILNRSAVQRYVAEVCPVPMSEEFPFKTEIEELFAGRRLPLALEVVLDGDPNPICRKHGIGLKFSDNREDMFVELQSVRIPAADNNSDAAIGWIAHSSYLGAIPKELGVRGLRLREGNIQIGDEHALDQLFREERFNRWCVGELHIVDERLIPNGRRDYFEPSPHIRQVENHLESIIRGIVSRCRQASTARNDSRKVQTMLQHMAGAYDLACSGYLKAEDARALILRALQNAEALEEHLNAVNPNEQRTVGELARLKDELVRFRPRRGRPRMGKVRGQEIATYRRVFRSLTELSPSPNAAKKIIESVIANA